MLSKTEKGEDMRNNFENISVQNVLLKPGGEIVSGVREWKEIMRPYWRELILTEEYGKIRGADKISVSVSVATEKEGDFAGKSCLQSLIFTFTSGELTHTVKCELAYPKSAENTPCPFFIYIDFRPGIPERYCPAEEIIDNGFGVFHVCHNDITTDDGDFENGLAKFFVRGERKSDDPGKIAIWSYFLQKMMDYLLTRPEADSTAIGVSGHSRLGKTALLTAALDERFAFCCPNNSGCSGVAISRGKPSDAESVAAICRNFPYWFCPKYQTYSDREEALPFDQHCVVSLVAPRMVCVGVAELDSWADNDGQMLALCEADKVWKLYGARGFVCGKARLDTGDAFTDGELGFFVRKGTHYHSRDDWKIYMSAVNHYLKNRKQ